jgi:hypothetical protein
MQLPNYMGCLMEFYTSLTLFYTKMSFQILKFSTLAECELSWKNTKKIEKKIEKKIVFFFGYLSSAANLRYACKNLGGLGSLVWA